MEPYFPSIASLDEEAIYKSFGLIILSFGLNAVPTSDNTSHTTTANPWCVLRSEEHQTLSLALRRIELTTSWFGDRADSAWATEGLKSFTNECLDSTSETAKW